MLFVPSNAQRGLREQKGHAVHTLSDPPQPRDPLIVGVRLIALACLIGVVVANPLRETEARTKRDLRLDKIDRAISHSFNAGHRSFRVLVRARAGAVQRVKARLDDRRVTAEIVSAPSGQISADVDRDTLAILSSDTDVEQISWQADVDSTGA